MVDQMKNKWFYFVLVMFVAACQPMGERFEISSTDGTVDVYFILDDGKPYYQVYYKDTLLVDTSSLGILFEDAEPLTGPFAVDEVIVSASRWGRWKPDKGQHEYLYDRYNQNEFKLKERGATGRSLFVRFRVYNYGYGLQYAIPDEGDAEGLKVAGEATELKFKADHTAWWAGSPNRLHYQKTSLSEMAETSMPVIFETTENRYVNIQDVKIIEPSDYSRISPASSRFALQYKYSPVTGETGFGEGFHYVSPWHTLQVTDDPADMALSTMIINFRNNIEREQSEDDDKEVKEHVPLVYNTRLARLSPEQICMLPFLYGLVSPEDFTPMTMEELQEARDVATLSKQLALMIILFNRATMVDELIEKYAGQPGYDLLRDIPGGWDRTRVLEAAIGDYIIVARRDKDDWFIGGITDEEAREFEVAMDFLDDEATYGAVTFADADESDWNSNPTAYRVFEQELTAGDTIKVRLAPGGGSAIHIKKQ
jgi:hypothetical protein